MKQTRTRIASHRGGTLLWPESSLTAFLNTAILPVEEVEFDIHQSRDGQLVVFHDSTIDRTTDCCGEIKSKNWNELKEVKLNGSRPETPLRPLLLEEVIDIFKETSITLRMEIKMDGELNRYPEVEEKAMNLLDSRGMLAERTIITSFMVDTLTTVFSIKEGAKHLWLISPIVQKCLGLNRVIRAAQEAQIKELSFNIDHLDKDVADTCRNEGLAVGAWAAHYEQQIRKAFDLNLTVFTSDDPVTALRIRKEYNGEKP